MARGEVLISQAGHVTPEHPDRQPGRPKYRLIRDAILELIRELPAGSPVPTERELCQRFGVSRATVRQALDGLELEQRIHRHQGRGTFVARPKIDQTLELSSHTETIRARGMEPASRLVGIMRLPADPEVAPMLGLTDGDEVFQIERVRLADDEPLAVELLYLDARRFDDIAAVLGESRSLYEVLRARYGVELMTAEETIEAAAAPEREAELLEVSAGTPVLVLSRQSFDADGKPVEFVRSCYRADRFRFRTRLQPAADKEVPRLPTGTRLRLASAADAPSLARVFVAAWRAGYVGIVPQRVLEALDEHDIADWLGTLTSANGPTTWVVETAEGEVVAFSRHGPDPSDGRRGHIYSLYVAPQASGRGIARALLQHDLGVLSDQGMETVTLWVFEENHAARNLYATFGFKPDGARRVETQYATQEIRLRRSGSERRARLNR